METDDKQKRLEYLLWEVELQLANGLEDDLRFLCHSIEELMVHFSGDEVTYDKPEDEEMYDRLHTLLEGLEDKDIESVRKSHRLTLRTLKSY